MNPNEKDETSEFWLMRVSGQVQGANGMPARAVHGRRTLLIGSIVDRMAT